MLWAYTAPSISDNKNMLVFWSARTENFSALNICKGIYFIPKKKSSLTRHKINSPVSFQFYAKSLLLLINLSCAQIILQCNYWQNNDFLLWHPQTSLHKISESRAPLNNNNQLHALNILWKNCLRFDDVIQDYSMSFK